MCRCVSVSRSAFYAWASKRRPTPKEVADAALVTQMREAHARSRRTYSSPRIQAALRRQGTLVGRHRIARLMRANGRRGRVRRRYRVTTDSNHSARIAPNRLQRAFQATLSDQKWCADITFIPVEGGFIYLAAVLDIRTRLVVGWSLADHMEASLVGDALCLALAWRRPAPGLIHHSDRGSQYASTYFQELLKAHGIDCSMSRKGDCWDNALMESFFGTLKQELVHDARWSGLKDARPAFNEYIEVFYNRTRFHSAIGYLTPIKADSEPAGGLAEVIHKF